MAVRTDEQIASEIRKKVVELTALLNEGTERGIRVEFAVRPVQPSGTYVSECRVEKVKVL